MMFKCFCSPAVVLAMCCVLPVTALAAPAREGEGYVARQESLRTFFDALSAPLGKPIVLSKAAARRTITGEFALADPQQTLERIARQMALIWYSDGQSFTSTKPPRPKAPSFP